MSWSGPVAGAAPYQPPHYPTGQPPWNQPPTYQYGQPPPQQQPQSYGQFPAAQPFTPQGGSSRPPETRPPKKKGNPIITRYPPPPGYRGPAQPQGPYGTQYAQQYQQPQSTYTQGPPVPPSYSTPGYQAPPLTYPYPPQSYAPPQTNPQQPAYPQPGYPPSPAYQWPQQPQQSYPPQPSYPPTPGYPPPQNSYPGYPPQPSPVDPTHQPWAQPQPQAWQQSAPQHPQSLPGSDPNATPTPTSAHPATTQGDPSTAQPQSATSEQSQGEKPPLFLARDDWDFDFDGAIWPKANEPVDPDFSLGVIIWRPAKQVTRALPANFAQAEEQALKPPAEKLGNGESVSIYFTSENSHEAFLDVRQTDDWDKIRKDPVFVEFTDEEMARNLIPIEDCIALRDRPDEPVEEVQEDDEEMHDASWSVMDGLEQALSGNAEGGGSSESKDEKGSQDKAQEDILAKLGVTGAPKPPSNEPMSFPLFDAPPPASLPPKPPVAPPSNITTRLGQPPSRIHSYTGHRPPSQSEAMSGSNGSGSASLQSQPPPPPHTQEYDPWNPRDTFKKPTGQIFDRSRGSPARSEDSNRAAGSELESERPASGAELTTVTPSLKRSDSSSARKRSYEDTDNEDGQGRQHEDYSKRKRRSQVDAAYRIGTILRTSYQSNTL